MVVDQNQPKLVASYTEIHIILGSLFYTFQVMTQASALHKVLEATLEMKF